MPGKATGSPRHHICLRRDATSMVPESAAVSWIFTSTLALWKVCSSKHLTTFSVRKRLRAPYTWPSEVFVVSRGRHGRRRSGVIEVARTREVDVIEVDGCIVTSVEFSLLQLARHATLSAALTATDAALRLPRFGGAAPLTPSSASGQSMTD